MTQLEESVIEQFWQDGAICLRNVFDHDLIEKLREAIDEDIKKPGPLYKNRTFEKSKGLFFVDFQLWQRFPACKDFVYHSQAASLIAQVLKSEKVFFYHDHLLVKEPKTSDHTPWHHDQPYYPLEGKQICSIWLPLDPVDSATCVKYIKGSHLWGKWFSPQFFNSQASQLRVQDSRFEPIPDFSAQQDQHEFLSWDMEPGDCILFHALTVHGASGNNSASRRRRAWATRWCGDDVRYFDRGGDISPPLTNHSLQTGDPLGCELFPQIN
jgi:ectoine hydroxylase-related dioxygenase (phytanoyl-CoA dioxygenase family)